jgi:hypothetical protein
VSSARTSSRSARTVLRFAPRIGLLLAVIAVVLLALAPIGWRGGWWPYRFSLLSLMAYSAYFGIAAVIVSVLALGIRVFGRSAIGRRGIAVAILALAAGGLTAYVPWHYRSLARSVPPIDDITTDTDNPPAFVAVINLRKRRTVTPLPMLAPKPLHCKSAVIPISPRCRSRSRPTRRFRLRSRQRRR